MSDAILTPMCTELLTLPPRRSLASKMVTSIECSSSTEAHRSPETPAPTTATLRSWDAGFMLWMMMDHEADRSKESVGSRYNTALVCLSHLHPTLLLVMHKLACGHWLHQVAISWNGLYLAAPTLMS